jgi:hypothetical protein
MSTNIRLLFNSLSSGKVSKVTLTTLPQLLADAKRILSYPEDFTKVYVKTKESWTPFDKTTTLLGDDEVLFLANNEDIPRKTGILVFNL